MPVRKTSVLFIGIFICLCLCLPAQASQDLDRALMLLAQKLVPRDGAQLVVAVADPEGPGSQLSQFSTVLVESLTGALLKAEYCQKAFGLNRDCQPGFKSVVERRRLIDLLEQQQIELSGVIDPKSRVELGKLQGITGLIYTKVYDSRNTLEISAKLVELATGGIKAMGKVQVKKDWQIRQWLAKRLFADLTILAKPIPPDAAVFIGNRAARLKPAGVIISDLPRGRHKLVIKAPCMNTYTLTIDLNRDRIMTFNLEPKKATLELLVKPYNADVSIDGYQGNIKLNQSGAGTVQLPAGNHTIRVMAQNYPNMDREVTLQCGRNHLERIDLTMQEVPLKLRVKPADAQFSLDGVPIRLDAKGNAELPVKQGKHVLTASAKGHQDYTRTLDVQGPQDLEVILNPEPVRLQFSGMFYDPKKPNVMSELRKDSVLKSGWYYAVAFKTTKRAWVYVYQMDSMGKVSRLFPLLGYPELENPVEPGAWVWVPPQPDQFWLDDNVGREVIYVVASPTRDARLENLYQRLEDLKNNPKAQASANKVLVTELVQRGPAGVKRIGKQKLRYGPGYFDIANQVLETHGQVYRLEFRHIGR